jgi:hypothetical protein
MPRRRPAKMASQGKPGITDEGGGGPTEVVVLFFSFDVIDFVEAVHEVAVSELDCVEAVVFCEVVVVCDVVFCEVLVVCRVVVVCGCGSTEAIVFTIQLSVPRE